MRNSNNSKNEFKLADLAAAVEAKLEGDGEVRIRSAAPVQTAGEGDIGFVANRQYLKYIKTSKASALILQPGVVCDHLPVLRHENPYLTFARIIDLLYPDRELTPEGIHPTTVVEADVSIDDTVRIGALCHICSGVKIGPGTQIASQVFIGENVSIGENCLLYHGVKILNDTKIGNNVTIHPGTVVGSDGFGFVWDGQHHRKIKQVGWVEIADDVEIGAGVTIDRGALGPTKIGRGTRIDNLVQIAHNVEIGEHCLIVAQAGVSGSSHLGNGVILAGQAGIVGHLEIPDGVTVAAQSGVTKSLEAGKTYLGSPAHEIQEERRIIAYLRKLPELYSRIKALESKSKDKK